MYDGINENWYIFDNKRSQDLTVDNDMLSPNLTDAEYDGPLIHD